MDKLTDREILAIKAVLYGANTNRKLVGGSYCENMQNPQKRKMMRFDEAIEIVCDLIDRIDMRKEDEGK